MNPVEVLQAVALAVSSAHADLLLAQPRYQDARSIARHRARAYSQNGEDGAIAEIFRRIGPGERTFLEIGAGNGEENCTRLLLECGWTGRWCESHPAHVAAIRAGYADELRERRLELIAEPITRGNAEALLAPAVGELSLLSLDIDMNTSHVWLALGRLKPRVAVIEYNPTIPPSVSWEVPYDPAAVWTGDRHFGASLKRLEEIGHRLGYTLVGCEITGVNAFFVRDDLVGSGLFLAPFTAEHHYEPCRLLPPTGYRAPARPRAQLRSAA